MKGLLHKLRQKSEQEKKIVAASVAGGIVFVILLVWATTFVSNVGINQSEQIIEDASTEQKATVLESLKRKIDLLVGEDGPLGSIEVPDFVIPIEYKSTSTEPVATSTSEQRDLQALLEEFKATSTAADEDSEITE